MNEIGMVLLVIGVIFDLLGCIGLVRLPDVYNRLQASTKSVTLGTWLILLGVFFVSGGFNATGVKALICIFFIVLTSPTAAHALARGAHKSGVKLWDKSVCDKYEEDKKNN
ncbi:Na+/H+ antiporter subunit G [Candidatus Desantisbacteria bacterium CG_4_10_14_0_8_um_filter_48_22]|uniref:Na+/H+ antiporter subunit G n=1 Tax=Candidatus Desantisbacteria bacterium CG_4_10_14_0_8_um_filter_48_22 TaxID=1974543 RepID=A0A2M7S916_9BACT|nr:MAG: Na+/H+ antiporter subunit G [Candidatus Desantisbacteria bacterium CG1_02_49_89]PIZ16001.1 MAG: Na+/H+ antiporter subunit G [Candidatus Desantisbacteria bacterium CG_4_10_14_0_8_um_filter_48_22]